MAHSQFTLYFLYGVYYHTQAPRGNCINTNCSHTYNSQAERVISERCKAVYYKEIIQTADSKSGNLDYNIYVTARLVIHIHSHLPIAENNEHRVTCLLRVKSDAIANVYLYLHCSYIPMCFLLFIIHGKALSLNSGIT